MTNQINEELLQKLKQSPDWRNDFRITSTEKINGITIYRVEANDQEPSTILQIARLNELLKN